MEKKCSKCGEVKDIRQFRYMRAQRRYNAYCKACECLYTKEYRSKYRKENLIQQIQKHWTELCENMSQCELDMRIYNLKEIYKQVQQEKANE